MENDQRQGIFNEGMRENLPNSTAVLVLGIVSIVTCFCYGIIGLACGIIALVLARKDMALYRIAPDRYMPSSFNNLKAGRVCAIIGTILSALYLVIIVAYIAILGTVVFSHPDEIFRHMH